MKNLLLVMLIALSLHSSSLFAVDGIHVGLGSGDESTSAIEAAAKWNWDSRWFDEGDWYVGGYWELGAGHWDGKRGKYRNADITHIGVTPVFRLIRQDSLANGVKPFVEAGIGLHLMSDDKIGDKDLGGEFAFANQLGIGAQFGGQHEVSVHIQHYSNAGMYDSNPGFDFGTIRYGYNF